MQRARQPSGEARWPWVVGVLVLGVPLSLVMPPFVLVLVIVLSVVLTRGDRPPAMRRSDRAIVIGLAMAGLVYLLIWSRLGISS